MRLRQLEGGAYSAENISNLASGIEVRDCAVTINRPYPETGEAGAETRRFTIQVR